MNLSCWLLQFPAKLCVSVIYYGVFSFKFLGRCVTLLSCLIRHRRGKGDAFCLTEVLSLVIEL